MKNQRQPSLFAKALAGLLDDTSIFSRDDWSEVLDVDSPPTLDSWTSDLLVPRADVLYMMIDIVNDSRVPSSTPQEAFEAMLDLPAEDVSPLGQIMLPTVRAYMDEGSRSLEFGLKNLNHEERMLVLGEGSWSLKAFAKRSASHV